jgi:hypothetical protein
MYVAAENAADLGPKWQLGPPLLPTLCVGFSAGCEVTALSTELGCIQLVLICHILNGDINELPWELKSWPLIKFVKLIGKLKTFTLYLDSI